AGWLDRAAARTGSGLDAWIVEREVQDAALYAETWIRDGGTRAGTPESEALMGAWLDDFAARGVDGVGFGYLTLRRPAVGAPTLRRIERLHSGLGHNPTGLGDHLQASLA
ncbi:SAM-dependent methyltransferase, partial [Clavibacter michiganensis subsp. insidiosus]